MNITRAITTVIIPNTKAVQAVPGTNAKGYQNEQKPHEMDTMLVATHQCLADYFRPHNACLYDFMGADFGWDS